MGLNRAQGRGRPLGLVSAQPGLELSPALPAELLSAAPSAREGQPGLYQLCLSPAQAPFPPREGPPVPTLQSHSGGAGELSQMPAAAWVFNAPGISSTKPLAWLWHTGLLPTPESPQAWLWPCPRAGGL